MFRDDEDDGDDSDELPICTICKHEACPHCKTHCDRWECIKDFGGTGQCAETGRCTYRLTNCGDISDERSLDDKNHLD